MTMTGIALDEQGSPIFWCVQGPGEIQYQDRHSGETGDMYTRCQQHPGGLLQGMHGTSFIVVCPQFYTLPITDSPPEEKCLTVNHDRFKGNGWEMGFFRMWLVLQELVQFYLYAITGSETSVQDVNQAIWLGAKASTRNARNYLYYVASKLRMIPLPKRRGRAIKTESHRYLRQLHGFSNPSRNEAVRARAPCHAGQFHQRNGRCNCTQCSEYLIQRMRENPSTFQAECISIFI